MSGFPIQLWPACPAVSPDGSAPLYGGVILCNDDGADIMTGHVMTATSTPLGWRYAVATLNGEVTGVSGRDLRKIEQPTKGAAS